MSESKGRTFVVKFLDSPTVEISRVTSYRVDEGYLRVYTESTGESEAHAIFSPGWTMAAYTD